MAVVATSGGLYSAFGNKGKRQYYEAMYGTLKTERSSYEAHWRDLADFMLPRRARFQVTDRNKGDRRNQKIIDSTGRTSARTLQSGMHGGLTSPARPWFKLTVPDKDLAKFATVRAWLFEVTARMQEVFGSSNLYNSFPTVYGDMGVFGTSAMAMLDDAEDLLRTYTYPIGSYVIGLDDRGKSTTFMHEKELTVRQLVRMFGGPNGGPARIGQPIDWRNISRQVKQLWDDGNLEASVPILWVVAPNPDADASKLGARFMPWVSCHFERSTQEGDGSKILRESGFKSFPIFTPRWDVTDNDSYGNNAPGMDALGDVKQLQGMQRKYGQAVEKGIDPPLQAPTALKTQKTSLLPGDITYVDVRDGMQGLRAIHEMGLNLQHMDLNTQQTQRRVREAFYADLFLMFAESDGVNGVQPITAAEVAERHDEKLLVLGPVLERTNDELLNPAIDRAYQLMEQRGMIPNPPQELDGVKLGVQYVSLLAQAQKLVGVVGLDRFTQTAANLTAIFPEVKRKIKVFRIIDNYAEMLGVDPEVVIEDAQAQAALDADTRQASAMAAAQTAATGAKAAKDAAAAPLGNGQSALSALISSGNTPPASATSVVNQQLGQ